MRKEESLNSAAIYHVPESVYSYPQDSNKLTVRIKTAKANCKKVVCRYKNIYEHTLRPYYKEMDLIATDEYCDYFETTISLAVRRFKYYFEIIDNEDLVWNFSSEGIAPSSEDYNEYFFYPFILDEEIPNSPKWAREGIIYQIFIDRFDNSDFSNDPPSISSWDSLPDSDSFFGGDFRGVINNLEYIASLGTTIIYLNPIFLSDTNHKYDTIDYYRIDPTFGTVSEAIELVRKAHEYGMRVILDAVFNHASNKNRIFSDVLEKGSKSEYFNWFCINGERIETSPPNYDSFAGLVPEMPRLNTSNTEVQNYLINVAVFWTQMLDIDGWRLDVADEVSHNLWKALRKRLREIKPDIFILGEVWNRATQWLNGDEFDGITNYKFRKYLVSFACDNCVSSIHFWNNVVSNEMNYKTSSLSFFANLISSHDVKRILTQMDGNKELVKLIFGVVMTYRGIPLLYYGDEIGLEGGDDPDNRRTMIWEEKSQDLDLKNFIVKLGKLRKLKKVFAYGTVNIIRNLPNRIIGFERTISKQNTLEQNIENVFILVNFDSESSNFNLKKSELSFENNKDELTSYFDGRTFKFNEDKHIDICLEGYDFIVLF